MKRPLIADPEALRERLRDVAHPTPAQQDQLPSYLEAFLAHLRLLVGVPFENLVPDPRLLPKESLRFFYLDRSWTDRAVDGALSVGKAGTREQAHHQERAPNVQAQLDVTERVVRVLQRGLGSLDEARASTPAGPAGIVTGLLLRSSAVAGWPHMDVRAFREPIADDAPAATVAAQAIRVLRLERIAPAVLLALFDGIPKLVWLEEPLHGIPLAFEATAEGFRLYGRPQIAVPFRAGGRRVVDAAALRSALLGVPEIPRDASGGTMAEAVLGRAFRQRFEGRGSRPVADGFAPTVEVAARVVDPQLEARLRGIFQ
jgi:hypothetical protein